MRILVIDASGVYAMSSGCQNQVARWRWFIEYREAHVCSSRYQYFIATRNEETACSPRLGEIRNCVRVFELRRRVCDCSDWCKATDGATDDSVMPSADTELAIRSGQTQLWLFAGVVSAVVDGFWRIWF